MEAKPQTLLFFTIFINAVSGKKIPQPMDLEMKIVDGEVTAFWKAPADAPLNFYYNVQMKKYEGWLNITHCTRITKNNCHLNIGMDDIRIAHSVRIQLVTGEETSDWTVKRFLPTDSKLLPPTFSLSATSSSLTVHMKSKPIMKELFPYGVTYTIYLQEKGKEIKNTTAKVKDEAEENVEEMMTFTSLHWGVKYCVRTTVEGNGGQFISNVSEPKCLRLPEQEWYIMVTASLSVLSTLSVLTFIVGILICYLRCPAKTPSSLTTPVKAWHPLSVEEGTIEVVTDKGWFLSSYGTKMHNSDKLSETHDIVTEGKEQESMRTRLDSGVTMESNSITTNGNTTPLRQEDSGCGSMGGPESSTCSQTDYPMDVETTESEEVGKSEDSGMDINCQLDSSSTTSDGQESVPLLESVIEGNYRRQSPAPVETTQVCDSKNTFEQTPTSSLLAEVVTGYRAGPQSCICSGAGQCSWCHKSGHHETCATKQYGNVSFENEILGSKNNLCDSYKRTITFSGYSSKTQLDTLIINDIDTTFLQLGKAVPLLTSLPLAIYDQDFNINNVSLSLCDIKLAD